MRRICTITPLLLAILVVPALAQAPRFDAWKVVGPGGGGTMIAPTISPHDPRLVVEHCDMTGGYITHDDGDSWRMFNLLTGIDTFAFDPSRKNVIYAGNVALWRSENRGRSWSMIFPNPHKNTVEHQVGDHADVFLTTDDPAYPGAGGITAIAVDPNNSSHIYIAFTQDRPNSAAHVSRALFSTTAVAKEQSASAVYSSSDNGVSWKRLAPIPQRAILLTFDRGSLLVVAGKGAYRVSSQGAVTALGQLHSDIFAASAGHIANAAWLYATTHYGKTFASQNGGRTWHDVTPSLGPKVSNFQAIATSAQNPNIAYVGFGTWQLKNKGIAGAQPFAWRLTRTGPGTLYLVISRRAEGRNPPVPGPGALYRSTDKAEHWVKMELPAGVDGPTGLTVDPKNPRRLYLTAWGHEGVRVDHGGGVYLSTDAGQTWSPIFQKSQHVYDLTLDPRNPQVLYITGFDSAAYRSTDAGAHWSRLKGYNFKWGHRVILDPNNPAKIYITTYGGGVWHGPASGDPNAQGDILTPIPIAH